MVKRADGRKKSDFVAQDTVLANSFMDYFVNNTNYRISYSNFVAGLGVTGSIVTTGSGVATPVLEIDGTVNKIRNIANGSGIITAVDAQNNVEVGHNFTVDSAGQPIMQNTTAASPTFVSISGGNGINVTTTGTQIEISSAELASYATVTMQGNSDESVIAVAGTPVKVAGTFVVGDVSGFAADTTGKITETESGITRHVINAIVSMTAASGTNHQCSIYIALNGSVIATTRMTNTISAGLSRSMATFANIELSVNDYIEIYVANDSTTDNLIVSRAVLGVL
jgi:hypothetical protein